MFEPFWFSRVRKWKRREGDGARNQSQRTAVPLLSHIRSRCHFSRQLLDRTGGKKGEEEEENMEQEAEDRKEWEVDEEKEDEEEARVLVTWQRMRFWFPRCASVHSLGLLPATMFSRGRPSLFFFFFFFTP